MGDIILPDKASNRSLRPITYKAGRSTTTQGPFTNVDYFNLNMDK